MPTTTKTELQIFLETAAGWWKAIGELANVASEYSTESLKREADKAYKALEKTLDAEIQDWNYMGDDRHPHIELCGSQKKYAPWNTDKCAIYVAGHGPHCPECLRQMAKHDVDAA